MHTKSVHNTDIIDVGFPNNILLKYDFLKFKNEKITSEEILKYIFQTCECGKKCTLEDVNLFLARYKDFKSVNELAEEYNMTRASIVGRLDKVHYHLMRLLKEQRVVEYKRMNTSKYYIGFTNSDGDFSF